MSLVDICFAVLMFQMGIPQTVRILRYWNGTTEDDRCRIGLGCIPSSEQRWSIDNHALLLSAFFFWDENSQGAGKVMVDARLPLTPSVRVEAEA
jgi:hypothetical protein